METKNIVLVGVGGQGTILAAKLLTTGLMEAGYDVKMSEIHGMSQRGGSVSSLVRYGSQVASPVIELGTADIVVAFEKMEALRAVEYLKPDGKLIFNDTEIFPLSVIIGAATYPTDIQVELEKNVSTLRSMKAGQMAEDMGNIKVMNVILLGSLVKAMGLTDINWEEIIEQNVKPQFVDLNIKALKAGMDAV
ncbi:MAG: indolepyruvate ferredoxin oxidoreductase, beta subunit [Eubacteriaceae bacterium]|jgi:indolepyruvate ferredoxin oxidoreductase beta subunit|nr:indolepyruvate ferredoxin oxidoreductase, beta subunit [Eubacteriaceae bacterium]MDK2904561.1 indolepyruvate ferredoxin oxidoreductase, beta subunit [Eubacteriaceae bacterium]MDK2935179.1 indolepyruvate ferredoxin oxidoreductase, beta subunit [Eubacteriaceae bacterium]MDK2961548.1 indolepyruvate ferredoxin oxidoreductase, beta subunit [Eubacteriaceae bacterium]MDN5307052.1 indolepyruvate ferredoxin oxidoreductase, beta subunit [Eubacteriaceae bacterium]